MPKQWHITIQSNKAALAASSFLPDKPTNFTVPRKHLCYQKSFTVVTWIVDGSEQPVSSSASMTLDAEFYCAKKKQHSISILMVVDMKGCILYLSPHFQVLTTTLLSLITQQENGYVNCKMNGD